MPGLMESGAAVVSRTAGADLEPDLDAFAASPTEIEQELQCVPRRARSSRFDPEPAGAQRFGTLVHQRGVGVVVIAA